MVARRASAAYKCSGPHPLLHWRGASEGRSQNILWSAARIRRPRRAHLRHAKHRTARSPNESASKMRCNLTTCHASVAGRVQSREQHLVSHQPARYKFREQPHAPRLARFTLREQPERSLPVQDGAGHPHQQLATVFYGVTAQASRCDQSGESSGESASSVLGI